MECQIATDWIVDEKALLEIKENGCLESQHIQTTIPGVGYYIQIHPNDKIENDDNVVYFHIYVDRPQFVDCDLDYTFSIPSAKFCETYDDDVNVVYACKRVAFFEPKNKYFQNGKITLQLRGTLKGDPMEEIEHDTFTQMLWYKDDKDFTIQIDDKEIKVHKLILRHCSPVFAAMFDSGMKEAQENKVKIEGFPFIAVRMAMEFCYDIKYNYYRCPADILLSLLKFSDIYDIARLKDFVELKLSKELSPFNVCTVANGLIEANSDRLRLCCMNYLIKCLKDSTAVAKLDSLDADFKSELLSKAFCHQI